MDLVEYLSRVFLVLRKTTLFSIIRKLLKKERDYGFVDTWVLVNTIASAIFSLITLQGCLGYLGVLICVYGCYRVLEILIYQINVVFFDWYRRRGSLLPYRVKNLIRSNILVMFNFTEIMFWFTITYKLLGIRPSSYNAGYLTYLLMSLSVMTGYGIVLPDVVNPLAMVVVLIHGLIGIFLMLVVIARFVSMIPPITELPEGVAS